MKKRKIKIYDLDGTLVNSSHRYRNLPNGSVDIEHWLENSTAEKVSKDTLLPLSEEYKKDIADPNVYVVIITARVETKYCRKYIEENLGLPDQLIFRPEGNTEPDYILKIREVNKRIRRIPTLGTKSVFFYDDNFKNVRAFAQLGIQSTYVPSNQGHAA